MRMWKALDVEAWVSGRQQSLDEARATAEGIIEKVRSRGDAALRELSRHVELTDIAVTDAEREAAYEQVDTQVVEALIEAEARITRFHERQRPRDLWLE
ncbi:MAG: histidinol dehydrogenase, partial [Methanomicrobiales archaeon]|nr:histidinol dehydrogenase [Methanomicrobiales archaeon]